MMREASRKNKKTVREFLHLLLINRAILEQSQGNFVPDVFHFGKPKKDAYVCGLSSTPDLTYLPSITKYNWRLLLRRVCIIQYIQTTDTPRPTHVTSCMCNFFYTSSTFLAAITLYPLFGMLRCVY